MVSVVLSAFPQSNPVFLFILIIKENIYLGIFTLALFLWLAALLGLLYVRLAKKRGSIQSLSGRIRELPKFKKYYTYVYFGMATLIIILIVLLEQKEVQLFVKYGFVKDPPLAPSQLVKCYSTEEYKIIVANFEVSGSDSFGVSKLLFSSLQAEVDDLGNVELIPLGRSIPTEFGREHSNILLDDCDASLIIWGWYEVTNSNALIWVNIEQAQPQGIFTLLYGDISEPSFQYSGTAEQAADFTLQLDMSNDVSAFVKAFRALILMDRGNASEAIKVLSGVIDNNDWRIQIVNQSMLYDMRATAHRILSGKDDSIHVSEMEKAIDDYSLAIKYDVGKYNYYSSRALALADIERYDEAMADLNQAMKGDKDDYSLSITYMFMGLLSNRRGYYSEAITYLTQSISIFPQNYIAYLWRSNAYVELGDLEAAASDYALADKYLENIPSYYTDFEIK